ncbi:MAG: hypothetical protein V9F04_04370 [Dermatophilaceae bacterium]
MSDLLARLPGVQAVPAIPDLLAPAPGVGRRSSPCPPCAGWAAYTALM